MKHNKPQVIEDAERETDSAKSVLAAMFLVAMLALFGILVQIASHVSVVTF